MDDLENAIDTARPYVFPKRGELVEALIHANRTAKRAPCVIGTLAHPSAWDRAHAFIDSLLDDIHGRIILTRQP